MLHWLALSSFVILAASSAAALTPLSQDRSVSTRTQKFIQTIPIEDVSDEESAPDFGLFDESVALEGSSASQISSIDPLQINVQGHVVADPPNISSPDFFNQADSDSLLSVSFQLDELSFYDLRGSMSFEHLVCTATVTGDVTLSGPGGVIDTVSYVRDPVLCPALPGPFNFVVCQEDLNVNFSGQLTPGTTNSTSTSRPTLPASLVRTLAVLPTGSWTTTSSSTPCARCPRSLRRAWRRSCWA